MGAASVPTQSRHAAETAREAGAAARLELAELLLTSDAVEECAQAAVAWLCQQGGARRAICALIDAESGRIVDVASRGVPAAQLQSLSIALDEPDHPLVFALA